MPRVALPWSCGWAQVSQGMQTAEDCCVLWPDCKNWCKVWGEVNIWKYLGKRSGSASLAQAVLPWFVTCDRLGKHGKKTKKCWDQWRHHLSMRPQNLKICKRTDVAKDMRRKSCENMRNRQRLVFLRPISQKAAGLALSPAYSALHDGQLPVQPAGNTGLNTGCVEYLHQFFHIAYCTTLHCTIHKTVEYLHLYCTILSCWMPPAKQGWRWVTTRLAQHWKYNENRLGMMQVVVVALWCWVCWAVSFWSCCGQQWLSSDSAVQRFFLSSCFGQLDTRRDPVCRNTRTW